MSKETAKAALSNLTDDEADLLNNSPELLARFREKHGLDQPQQVPLANPPNQKSYELPEWAKTSAQAATTPIRGIRALGVAAQRLASGVSPMALLPGGSLNSRDVAAIAKNAPLALERSAAATKPGYIAIPGERTGAALGEAAGIAGLTAPLAAITPASLLGQMALGAGTGAGISSAMDASEEGKFYPKRAAVNAAVGGLLPILASEGVNNAAAKTAGALAKVQSGVDQRAGERLFKDPGAFLAPSEKTVGAELGAFRKANGIEPIKATTKEILDSEGSLAKKTILKVDAKLEEGAASKAELLRAKQSVNKLIEKTPFAQKTTRANLFELKNKFADALEVVVPGDQAASAKYARSALAGKFRKMLPVTKTGDISLTRTLFLPQFSDSLPAGIGSVVAGAVQSPALAGAEIATAGAAAKGAQSLIKNPITRVAGQSLLQQATKVLTRSKAIKLFKQALQETGGDEKKARKLANEKALKQGFNTDKIVDD